MNLREAKRLKKALHYVPGSEFQDSYALDKASMERNEKELYDKAKRRSSLRHYEEANLIPPEILNVQCAMPLASFASDHKYSEVIVGVIIL